MAALGAALLSCENDYPPSLYDPNAQSKPQPVVESVIPPDSAFAGVGQIVIQGRNFSPRPEENLVFFNGTRAEVLEASETQLVVKTPNLVADSVVIKIAVHGAELFSEPILYRLIAAVAEFGSLLEGEVAYGIAADRQGNLYVSVEGKVIKKITPQGKTSIFTNTSFLRANAMKMGPGDTLYAVAAAGRARVLQRIAPDGTASTFVTFPSTPRDFDFDESGNIWIAVGSDIYRVGADKSKAKADSYPVSLQAVRVFNGSLYVAGWSDATGEQKLWRSAIQGDALAEKEVVLDLASAPWLEGAHVWCLNFAADGTLYLGTDHAEGVFVVPPDGDGGVLYPGLISPVVYAMTWPQGQAMYAVLQVEGQGKIVKINLGKDGAPYFGRR